MRTIGIIIGVAGIMALIYSGFNYTTQEKVVDLGPIKIDKEKKHTINWPPITGIVLLLGGVALYAADRKNS